MPMSNAHWKVIPHDDMVIQGLDANSFALNWHLTRLYLEAIQKVAQVHKML